MFKNIKKIIVHRNGDKIIYSIRFYEKDYFTENNAYYVFIVYINRSPYHSH